jgi:hypothetical protein
MEERLAVRNSAEIGKLVANTVPRVRIVEEKRKKAFSNFSSSNLQISIRCRIKFKQKWIESDFMYLATYSQSGKIGKEWCGVPLGGAGIFVWGCGKYERGAPKFCSIVE